MKRLLFFLCLVTHTCQAAGAVGGIIGGSPSGITAKTLYANNGANLFALKTSAAAGTTIVVGPGGYSATNLWKNGVNWHFMAGAIISNRTDTACGIFDNSALGTSGAITSNVTGSGTFIMAHSDANFPPENNCVSVVHSNSMVSLSFKKITASGEANGIINDALHIADGTVFLSGEEVTGDAGAFKWDNGNCRAFIGNIEAIGQSYALWGTGNKPANLYLRCNTITATNYFPIAYAPTDNNNKLWIYAHEIYGNPTAGSEVGTVEILGGKAYITAQKISSDGGLGTPVLFVGGTAQLWLDAQKVTTRTNAPFFQQTNGFSRLRVMQWEDSGTIAQRPYNFLVTGGTNEMWGGRAETTWGPGYKLTGGQAYLRGLTLNTFSTLQGSNVCLWITGGTPILENCTFIPGSLFSVSNSSAGDLRVWGTGGLRCKSNITATLTVRVGTVTVDGTYVDR